MRPTRGTYRHIRTTDIELEVLRVQYRAKDYTKVKAEIWRRDFGCGRLLLDTARTYKISRKEEDNWKMYSYLFKRYV